MGRNGSVDWCCLPDLDRPSVFAALLDARRGGRFRVSARGAELGEQMYLGDTCVLETRFRAPGGILTVTDWMPLEGSIIGACRVPTEPEIYRLVRCEAGEVEVEVEWSPRFDYARATTRIERTPAGYRAHAGTEALLLGGVPGEARIEEREDGPALVARFPLRAGESVSLVTGYAATGAEPTRGVIAASAGDAAPCLQSLKQTSAAWVAWAHDNEEAPTAVWAGEWSKQVTRSELTLKLLTHPETGAIAAAPTTSLPERIGGPRNWDYRFCWIRDSVFTVQALYALGHRAEATEFLHFLEHAARSPGAQDRWGVQIMYGLHGETDLHETVLDHLEGYRGSRPVRIGNGAAQQEQHDTLGELIDAAHELVIRGEELAPELWDFLAYLADRACAAWHEPDHGIWEMRGPKRHFVYSKVMVWRALDRAVSLAETGKLRGNVARWRTERDALRAVILERGFNPELNSFVQSFDSVAMDASNLLIPIEEFLPVDDPRVHGTIDATQKELLRDGLVFRYRTEEAEDGLAGGEGAFGLCTFWLVDALALCGRTVEARELFEGMLRRASPLGLYSEQIEPRSGQFLGNFPQAFTHLGLVNSALYLAHAAGRPVPWSPTGSGEHRAAPSDPGANA